MWHGKGHARFYEPVGLSQFLTSDELTSSWDGTIYLFQITVLTDAQQHKQAIGLNKAA